MVVLVVLLAFVLAGWALGSGLLFFVLAISVYLAWQLYNLVRLQHWLHQADLNTLPVSRGIWGTVFDGIYRLREGSLRRRKRHNRLLKRFYKLAAALPDATVMLGEHDVIEWYNKPAQRLLGLRPSIDVGQYVGNLLRHPVFHEYLARQGGDEPVEIPSPVDENRVLSVRLVSYGKNRRLLTARDVTQLHRLEQLRRDFVADVSHELRTPLTVVRGYLEAMGDSGTELPPEWRRSIGVMEQQTRRMERIVTDLLFLARMESASALSNEEIVEVPALIATVRDDALALDGSNERKLVLDLDVTLQIRGNEEALRSVFSNLVFNAVQYTSPGDTITVCWRRLPQGQGACFEVKDDGPGIASRHIPRLTERFYRIDVGRSRERGGTGLGLAIVKHVMNRFGGRLEIESEEGKGSRFCCIFPEHRVVWCADPPERPFINGR